MEKPIVRITLPILAVCILLGFAYAFYMARRRANDPAQIRQTAMATSIDACNKSARHNPRSTGISDQQLGDYCTCFATKGFAQYSDSEIVAATKQGGGASPSDKARFAIAANACSNQYLPHK